MAGEGDDLPEGVSKFYSTSFECITNIERRPSIWLAVRKGIPSKLQCTLLLTPADIDAARKKGEKILADLEK